MARDNQRLHDQALRDGLTDVANRRQFNQQSEEVERQRERAPLTLSLLLIDVDEFKRYNDHFGHVAGDACLRAVAHAMQTVIAAAHLLARYSGEEFFILMSGVDANTALALGNNYLNAFKNWTFHMCPALNMR